MKHSPVTSLQGPSFSYLCAMPFLFFNTVHRIDNYIIGSGYPGKNRISCSCFALVCLSSLNGWMSIDTSILLCL